MFNVSMNPFRQKAEKRRQISSLEDGRKKESRFALSNKHLKLDPEFSLDGFLSRLQQFRQQQFRQNQHIPIINEKPILPPKPSSKSKNVLSTKCFVEIFKRLPAKDLSNLRFVCKEFNQIIQNHAMEFDTVFLPKMELAETSNNYFIRSFKNQSLPKLSLHEIDRPLRHLKTDKLDLKGITVSQKVIRYLLRSFKYQIMQIKFDQCRFLISADTLARMINSWKPKSLEFSNCSWNLIDEELEVNFDQIFIDFFFSRHQNLDSLIIDFSKMPQQKLEITDKIAQIFNDPTKLPSTLIFKNCLTNITAKTIHNAIWSYIESVDSETSQSFSKSFNWNFGQITDSEDTVELILSRFNQFILTQKREGNQVEIIFRVNPNFPILNFCVDFEEESEAEKENEKEEEENLSEIEWDDSMDSDAFILSSDKFKEPVS